LPSEELTGLRATVSCQSRAPTHEMPSLNIDLDVVVMHIVASSKARLSRPRGQSTTVTLELRPWRFPLRNLAAQSRDAAPRHGLRTRVGPWASRRHASETHSIIRGRAHSRVRPEHDLEPVTRCVVVRSLPIQPWQALRPFRRRATQPRDPKLSPQLSSRSLPRLPDLWAELGWPNGPLTNPGPSLMSS
jgi:hypothetical protein